MLFFRFDRKTGDVEIVPTKPTRAPAAPTVFKGQVLAEASQALGLSAPEVDRVLKQVLAGIAGHLKAGNPVMIKGFGKFKPRKARSGKSRDPRNGRAVKPSGRRSVTFRPSNGLKSLLV